MSACCPTCGAALHDHRHPGRLVAAVRLSRTERRIVERMAADFGSYVGTDALVRAICEGGSRAATPDAVVGKLIQRARRKLGTVGLTIESGSGGNGGRRLTWTTTP